MLGSAVFKSFMFSEDYEIYGVSRNHSFQANGLKMFYGDLSDSYFTNSFEVKFDIVIHCSAEVNVNLCEIDKAHAFNSNVKATENIVSLNPKLMVYISTDAVFDGQKGGYDETSEVKPLNYYAKTKLLGEDIVRKSKNDYLILRTNIFGFNQPLKNSLFEWAYKELSNGSAINGYSNMYFNPLYVGQISELLKEWVDYEIESGTYNLGSDESISKHNFLEQVIEVFNFNKNSLNSVCFNAKNFDAPRALNTNLNTVKVKKIFINFDFKLQSGLNQMKSDFENLNKKN